MKDLIYEIVRTLVDNPDDVNVVETTTGNTVHIKVLVNSNDMGKVIGKQGRIAKAIRLVAKAVATKNNQIVEIEIAE